MGGLGPLSGRLWWLIWGLRCRFLNIDEFS